MKRTALIILALAFAAGTGEASQIDIALTQAYVYTYPGETVSFDAIVSAPSSQPYSAIYLNGDSYNIDNALSLDDSLFFTNFLVNFPMYIYPGDSMTGTLVTVSVPLGTASGIYGGSFGIVGGSDSNAGDLLGSATFSVEVGPAEAQSEVPEPRGLAAALVMLLLLACRVRRRPA
jgi:hypothetical protein